MSVIKTKKELQFYIKADLMMNRGVFHRTYVQFIKELILPDPIMRYLRVMRKLSFYCASKRPPLRNYYLWRFNKLSLKLGFSIGHSVFGYGLVIPHWGTIVVGAPNTIGNYAVLHTSTCITANDKVIGDNLYLATGAKVTSKIVLGKNVTIAANSVVNKSFEKGNVLLAGAPAIAKRTGAAWYEEDNNVFKIRVEAIEVLKRKMGL